MRDMSEPQLGSYAPEDITFLLKPVSIAPTGVAEKEAMIQSGRAHYSEMISEERRPDERYLEIFEQARGRSRTRIAREICAIALHLRDRIAEGTFDPQVTLCSLVRAGVPYGVLLHRELVALGIDSRHYGISIIRDRGLDEVAMQHVLAERPALGVLFVDGWTGKGAISRELRSSWQAITGMQPEMVVLADPSGHAAISGSHEDWLIPSGILGANISGLVSRSILRRDLVGPGDFHGSMPVSHLADIDMSRDFVDEITSSAKNLRGHVTAVSPDPKFRATLRAAAADCVSQIARAHGVENLNRIKPGIAEATRAVLRRRPDRVFVRSLEDHDLAALVHLCRTDGIDLVVDGDITFPYRAITLIKRTS
ncbi:MAG: hypothetical protein CMO01_00810 [Thalassobius sp.]|nr:hypothetical protein [Thalassovita sp.]